MSPFRAEAHWTVPDRPERPVIRRLRTRRSRHVVVPALTNPLAPVVATPVLLPIIGVNDEILPAVEERLHPIALRARAGDRAARNALYAAFEPKLRRIARRLTIPHTAPGDTPVWDRDDIEQETFIVFTDLIESWNEQIPIARYILANIPWRLRDAVYRGVGRRTTPPRTTAVDLSRAFTLPDPTSPNDPDHDLRALIATLAPELTPFQRDILHRHILDGATLSAIAIEHGLSRRTITRHWRATKRTILIQLTHPDAG